MSAGTGRVTLMRCHFTGVTESLCLLKAKSHVGTMCWFEEAIHVDLPGSERRTSSYSFGRIGSYSSCMWPCMANMLDVLGPAAAALASGALVLAASADTEPRPLPPTGGGPALNSHTCSVAALCSPCFSYQPKNTTKRWLGLACIPPCRATHGLTLSPLLCLAREQPLAVQMALMVCA